MTRISMRGAALVIAASALAGGCAGTASTPSEQTALQWPASAGTVISMSGFPHDRSLRGLVGHPDVDAVLVVTGATRGASYWNTPDGKVPAYVVEGRNQTADEAKRLDAILTPVTATVQSALAGSGFKPGDKVTLVIPGGTVGDVAMSPDTDVAPPMDQLLAAKRLLVAGPSSGSTMNPYFVYSVGSGDRVKSLLGSASDEPDFTIGDLVSAIAARK